jgi:hypothetical protein
LERIARQRNFRQRAHAARGIGVPARVVRATMLLGTKWRSQPLEVSGFEFKHHPYPLDRIRIGGDEIERGACVGNRKRGVRLPLKHESRPVGAHLREILSNQV